MMRETTVDIVLGEREWSMLFSGFIRMGWDLRCVRVQITLN